MEERLFRVFIDGSAIAKSMPLQDALLLVEAEFNKFYNDDISINIEREWEKDPVGKIKPNDHID